MDASLCVATIINKFLSYILCACDVVDVQLRVFYWNILCIKVSAGAIKFKFDMKFGS